MSRASTKGAPTVKIPSGDLAAVGIGIETIVLPRTAAQKLLALLERGLIVRHGYSSLARRNEYIVHEACRPDYIAIEASQVRAASAEERDEHNGS